MQGGWGTIPVAGGYRKPASARPKGVQLLSVAAIAGARTARGRRSSAGPSGRFLGSHALRGPRPAIPSPDARAHGPTLVCKSRDRRIAFEISVRPPSPRQTQQARTGAARTPSVCQNDVLFRTPAQTLSRSGNSEPRIAVAFDHALCPILVEIGGNDAAGTWIWVSRMTLARASTQRRRELSI